MTGEVDDDIDLNLFSSLVKLDHVTSKSGESISIKHFYLGRVGRVAEPPAAARSKNLSSLLVKLDHVTSTRGETINSYIDDLCSNTTTDDNACH